jgi:hypothetical protein
MLHQRHHKDVAARLDAAVVAVDRAPRLRGSLLREALARLSPPATIELGPGKRIIGGRVFYSAAWLSWPQLVRPFREHLTSVRAEHSRPGVVPMAVDRSHRADAGRAPAHVAMVPLLGML